MSRKYLPSLVRCKRALFDSHGFVAVAAKRLGIHYTTLYKIIKQNPELKDNIIDQREFNLDVSESKLFNAVQNDQPWAIQFHLRTQGRTRGYSERLELTGEEGSPLNAVTFNLGDIPFSDETKKISVELLRSLQNDVKGGPGDSSK